MLPEFVLLHFSKDGLKAQKVYSPEQRSGYKLTIYLARCKRKRKDKNNDSLPPVALTAR